MRESSPCFADGGPVSPPARQFDRDAARGENARLGVASERPERVREGRAECVAASSQIAGRRRALRPILPFVVSTSATRPSETLHVSLQRGQRRKARRRRRRRRFPAERARCSREPRPLRPLGALSVLSASISGGQPRRLDWGDAAPRGRRLYIGSNVDNPGGGRDAFRIRGRPRQLKAVCPRFRRGPAGDFPACVAGVSRRPSASTSIRKTHSPRRTIALPIMPRIEGLTASTGGVNCRRGEGPPHERRRRFYRRRCADVGRPPATGAGKDSRDDGVRVGRGGSRLRSCPTASASSAALSVEQVAEEAVGSGARRSVVLIVIVGPLAVSLSKATGGPLHRSAETDSSRRAACDV